MRWMKSLAASLAAGLLACAAVAASPPISQLPAASALAGGDKFAAVQGSGCATGVSPCSNVAPTAAQITTYVSGSVGTAFGRSILNAADAPSTRALLSVSATGADTSYPLRANNLSDLANVATARGNLSAAKSGANSDITSLAGLTTALSVGQGGTGGTTAATARAGIGIKRSIPSGRYMVPEGVGFFSAGSAPGSNSMRCFAGAVREPITINSLAIRLTTAASGGNVQLAIYAADATSLMPTGAALYSSAAGNSTTTVTGIVETGLSVSLDRGLYWWCTNEDSNAAAAVYTSMNANWLGAVSIYGAATASGGVPSSAAPIALSRSQTYGTWPTLTGSYSTDSWAEVSATSVALMSFRAN